VTILLLIINAEDDICWLV